MQKFVIKLNYLSSFFIKNVIKEFTDKLMIKYKNNNCIPNLFYCSCSVTQTCPTLFDPMNCSTPGFPVLHYHPQFDQTHVPDNIQPPHTLLPSFPLSLNISSIRVFTNELALCIRWPKYQSFGFRISPSNEQSGLISFRIHWFDLLAIQGTHKSPFQYHGLKASILRCSAFFGVGEDS